MYFAHMIGEHHFENRFEQITHTVSSWAGLVVAVIIAIICAAILLRNRKTATKEEIEK